METAQVFSPLSPSLEALAQVLAASLEDEECQHDNVTLVAHHDFGYLSALLYECDDCGHEFDADDQ